MKIISSSNHLFLGCLILAAASCVPARKFNDLQTRESRCQEETGLLRSENQRLTTLGNEQSAQISELEKRKKSLELDTLETGNALRKVTGVYNELSRTYEKLLTTNEKLIAGNSAETKKLISQLQMTQEDLQKREDELKVLSKTLSEKQKSLEETNRKLIQREARVQELESVLNKKDSTVKALKNTVTDALLGFKDKGLTVELKNGKVYVSLEERLLFASGSTVVDPKGVEALKQLAKVLEKNQDINVMVEGHTDNVPIAGGAIKDNWDLSVMRATSVIRIMTSSSSIDPKRLIAAGRGPYLPIDAASTSEARKKNRRTEIILTPKLDELLKVLEAN